MLEKNLLSAARQDISPSESAARPAGPRYGCLSSSAFALVSALILIGLGSGPLSAQSGNPSEITAGPISVESAPPAAAPVEVAPLPDVPPAQRAPQEQPPAGLVPPTFSIKTPAQAVPAQAPVPAAPAQPQAKEPPTELPQGAELTEITKELAKADTSYRQGDYIGALDALWAAQEMMWRRAPLGVRNVAFVSEQPENFGSYIPKVGEDFKIPEPLILYCEPIGFTQAKENDTYKYSIIGAFDILDAAGVVLGGQRNLGPYEQSGYRTFSTETMLVMTIGISRLSAGSYIMRITLTDNLDRTKSVQLDKPFNIVE